MFPLSPFSLRGQKAPIKSIEVVKIKNGTIRRIAIEILDEFEELLESKNITIPADDREGKEEEGLYGSEYYELEDRVVEILKNGITV